MSNKFKKQHYKIKIIALFLILAVILFIAIVIKNSAITKRTVELMDMYGEISPFGEMSYGDKYISNQVFEPIIEITNEYKINPVIAKTYTIDDNKITFSIKHSEFKTPDGNIEVTAEYLVEYFNSLIRMQESGIISNPGIENIYDIYNTESEITIEFNSKDINNILALAENIGYQQDGLWYGTKSLVEYNKDSGFVTASVNNTVIKYITARTTPGLDGDERITNMILGRVLADDTVTTEHIVNNAYGFLTWGKSGIERFDKNTRQIIFDALENSNIRDYITHDANSIYNGTELYKKHEIDSTITADFLKNNGITVNTSLKIGVIDLGSFSEVENAITEAFKSIGIPIKKKKKPIAELMNEISSGVEYDLIYLRLERGLSPDISGLFKSVLNFAAEDYISEVASINKSNTWEDLCENCGLLDKKLRDDGIWMFLDQGYDLRAYR